MVGYGSRLIAIVLSPLLFPQSRVVLSHLPTLPETPGPWSGTIDGPDPVRLLVFGDSTAAGVGVDSQKDALVTGIATELAKRIGRGVEWKVLARSGATTSELRAFFLPSVERGDWDYVFMTMGVNDVNHLRRKRQFTRDLDAMLDGIEQSSPRAKIALNGIPRMQYFRSLPHPLGTVLGARAHRLNLGAHEVLRRHPRVVHTPPWPIKTPGFFATDDFHPSAIGYAAWSKAAVAYWLRG
jgi:lysophospholipase L1-like esterase